MDKIAMGRILLGADRTLGQLMAESGRVTPYGADTTAPLPDIARLRRYRLERIRRELKVRDYAGAVFFDPINVRYCTDSRNMQIWTLRNPARYVFVATEGPVVMFEFAGCNHLLNGLELIDEIRPATSWFFFTSGPRMAEKAQRWAKEIADLVVHHGGGNKRLAVDRLYPEGYSALQQLGIQVVDGQEPAEHARSIKSTDELACLKEAIRVCETGLAKLEAAIEPGLSENQLWSVLHETNIAMGGEYIETRLLTSGPKTNPWFQEAGDRIIESGDIVAVDTDMNGPYGYFADMSRTFFCGPGKPTDGQKRTYQLAFEQIHKNLSLIKPGVNFREFAENSWPMPEEFLPHRYMSLVHGAGLAGEYPYIPYLQDFAIKGYDGLIQENMTLCIESFIGSTDGGEGVKLEQLVQVTSTGAIPLTHFKFDDALLG